jgi:hypothetical protein
MIEDLEDLANKLDQFGLYAEADMVDGVLRKIAQTPESIFTQLTQYMNSVGMDLRQKKAIIGFVRQMQAAYAQQPQQSAQQPQQQQVGGPYAAS